MMQLSGEADPGNNLPLSLLVPADVAHSGLRGDNDNDHWGIIVIGLMTRQVSDIQTRHLMPDTLALLSLAGDPPPPPESRHRRREIRTRGFRSSEM